MARPEERSHPEHKGHPQERPRPAGRGEARERPAERRIEREREPAREPGAAAHGLMAAPITWGAVWAGLVSIIAVQTLLTVLGVAVGLAGFGQITGTAAAIWAGVSMLIALFIGGYVTGVLSHPAAMIAKGAWSGFVLWSLVVTFALILTVLGAAGAVGFFGAIFSPQAAGVTGTAAFIVLALALVVTVLGSIAGVATRERR
jgi:hypothetical protein